MHNIVILGASSFIGRQLLQRLSSDKYTVTAFIKNTSLRTSDSLFANQNISTITGDYQDPSVLKNLFHKGDIVFNLISSSTPNSSAQQPVDEVTNHIDPQVRLIETACKANIAKLIFFSSGGGIYGNDTTNKRTETDAIHPSSPHSIAKATIEYYQNYFCKKYGVPSLIYRLSNPYGPGQVQKPGFGLIPTLFEHAINNTSPRLYDNGLAVRDFIYIDDLLDAIMCSYDKNNEFETYNIGSGVGTQIKQVWELIKQITQSETQPIYLPKREFDIHSNVLDIQRFAGEFGWEPKIQLIEGLKKTLAVAQR